MRIRAPASAKRRYAPEMLVIRTSEFSTIAVLVAATAAVVAIQQHRVRERRLPSPPAIEAESVAPTTDSRLGTATGVDLAITSRPAAEAR